MALFARCNPLQVTVKGHDSNLLRDPSRYRVLCRREINSARDAFLEAIDQSIQLRRFPQIPERPVGRLAEHGDQAVMAKPFTEQQFPCQNVT
jgi:hypothetical protein